VPYRDREQAGTALAKRLSGYADRPDVTVLALVRGGVPVAAPIAEALRVPLDVLVVRKLGVPWAPEVAFGAVGPGGVIVHNRDVEAHLTAEEMAEVVAGERSELERREERYRSGRPTLDLTGRTAIIVDDGLATGATARAAVAVARGLGAARVVVAVPVGAPDAVALLRAEADEVICPLAPPAFGAVGRYYGRFPQVSDADVVAALAG
jgi:putative phosphoribosyl transferase